MSLNVPGGGAGFLHGNAAVLGETSCILALYRSNWSSRNDIYSDYLTVSAVAIKYQSERQYGNSTPYPESFMT
jgi:hypothetical protein